MRNLSYVIEVIFGSEEWEIKAGQQILSSLFPKVDFVALENGLSASQLGSMVGHQMYLLNNFERLMGFIETKCEHIQAVSQRLASQIESEISKISPEVKGAMEHVVNWAGSTESAFEDFLQDLRPLVALEPKLRAAINYCLEEAGRQEGDEARKFFEAFGKALSIETLNSEGKMITGNAKTSWMYSALVILGDSVRSFAKSVPELQRLLARMIGDGLLTRDESSIQWEEDRKSLEGVCRKLGLSFRKSGRPRNKEIPNHKSG